MKPEENAAQRIRRAIRDIPDFPKPGIVFKDITPLIADGALLRDTVSLLIAHVADKKVNKLAAVDARGFIFGGAMCERMGIGMAPIRKAGKLPYKTYEASYDLEYGSATLAVHQDAFGPGDRVVLVDDLLATGGTAAAAIELIEVSGASVVSVLFVVELAFLNGRAKLTGRDVYAPVVY